MTLLPTKQIQINVSGNGTPFYNYDCTGIEYAPNTVVIAGKSEDLAKITALELKCDISNARADVEAELSLADSLKSLYGDMYILVGENNHISVKATIERMQSKTVSLLTGGIELQNLKENLEVEFTDVTTELTVVAVPKYLNDITAASLNPYIDCLTYTEPGIYMAIIHTQTPEYAEVKYASIQITVSEKAEVPVDISEADAQE